MDNCVTLTQECDSLSERTVQSYADLNENRVKSLYATPRVPVETHDDGFFENHDNFLLIPV